MKKLNLLAMAGLAMASNIALATSLSISTGGREGATSASHSFTTQAETRAVKVTYQFITSEVPGGYYGSQYNDYYSVAIQTAGDNASDASSMNALGLAAFDANGATNSMDVVLDVTGGSVVQVRGTVANVGDQYYDSNLVIESIEELAINVESASILDIDDQTLTHFSGADHPYFAGQTPVKGTIEITGPEDESLSSVELNVIQGGATVATGTLHPDSANTLLTTFGPDETVEIATSTMMFNIPATNGIDVDTNGSVSLQLSIEASTGDAILHDLGSVPLLARFTGNNRYGNRDAGQGGDSWAKLTTVDVADQYGNHLFGDFSNMHGGQFAPHASHRTGNDVDGWFNGYNARNAATANTLIDVLNDDSGSQIERVFVTFSQNAADDFWTAIENVDLDDGRRARNVIRPLGGHTTHYHWRISE